MKIKTGHKVKIKDRQGFTLGVVYKIQEGRWGVTDQPNIFTIYVKRHDSLSFSVITKGKLEYDEFFIYEGSVSPKETLETQAIMKVMEAPPVKVKKTVSRPVAVKSNALVTPNTDYSGKNVQIFVKSKKEWFTLDRTTAKMAFYDGGRCLINNVEEIR